MKKYNLTLLIALGFIAKAGYGMDDFGAAWCSNAAPTSAVPKEETNRSILTAGAGGEADAQAETVEAGGGVRTRDDERMEELRTEAKNLISLRDRVASRYLENLISEYTPDRVRNDLRFFPLKLWSSFFPKEGEKFLFDLEKFCQLASTFQGFTAMTDARVDEYIIEARRIRDRDMSPLPTLSTSTSGILRKKTDAHTTLVLGCGRTGGYYAACPNHEGKVNPHHYTVDMDRSRSPELFGSFLDQRVWNTLGENSFAEIIMEGVTPYIDIRVMRAAFKALRPGGVLRVMHIQPSVFLDADLKPSVDVPLFASFQNFTCKSLLDLSLNDYLTKVIGFESVEIYTPKTLDKGKRGKHQWRAFKGR